MAVKGQAPAMAAGTQAAGRPAAGAPQSAAAQTQFTLTPPRPAGGQADRPRRGAALPAASGAPAVAAGKRLDGGLTAVPPRPGQAQAYAASAPLAAGNAARNINPFAERAFLPTEIGPAGAAHQKGRPAAAQLSKAARQQRPAAWHQAGGHSAGPLAGANRPLEPSSARPVVGPSPLDRAALPLPAIEAPKRDLSLSKPAWRALPAPPPQAAARREEPAALPEPMPIKPSVPSITVLVNESVPVAEDDGLKAQKIVIDSPIELQGDEPAGQTGAIDSAPLNVQGESLAELWADEPTLARLQAPIGQGETPAAASLLYSAIKLAAPGLKPPTNEPLLVGPVSVDQRRQADRRKKKLSGPAELPPQGMDPPMFPRFTVPPAGLIDPDSIEIVEPKGPSPMRRAMILVGSAFKSVSVAAYRFSKEQFDKVPRPVLTSSVAALVFGALIGGWAVTIKDSGDFKQLRTDVADARMALQTRRNTKLESLQNERARLREEILRTDSISQDYPDGSIPRALAVAASEEFKIADTLLLQQIAALESNAKITVSVKQTTPDPDLAATLETEMQRMRDEIGAQAKKSEGLAETAKVMADTSVATQMVSLAILNRNHLIAKYGLSSPVPLQYQSSIFTANLDRHLANSSAEGGGEDGDQVLGLLDDMRRELERLRAENELLLNSDSTLYASAVSDLGIGRLASAEEKFVRLVDMFPGSSLAPKAKEGLTQIKVLTAQREAAKKPPVQVAYTAVRHDGGYFKNESYVRVSFRNISKMMIKKVEFKVLTFDEHGYPVGSKRLSMTNDNILTATMHDNVPPGKNDYGVWELSDKVRQVKIKLKEVEFYDSPAWRDEDIDRWVEKEGARYMSSNGKAS